MKKIIAILTIAISFINSSIAQNSQKLNFNFNSTILTQESTNQITNFCDNLYTLLRTKETINIFIKTHSKLGTGGDKNQDINRQKKMLMILSVNRAQMVKDLIIDLIKNETLSNKIIFHVYPTSFEVENYSGAEIIFDETEQIKLCKAAFEKLAVEYKIPHNINGLENLTTYLENKPLQDICIDDIKNSIINNRTSNNILIVPLEYYYDSLEGYYGFIKSSKEREKIKNKLIRIIKNESNGGYSLKDFVFPPK